MVLSEDADQDNVEEKFRGLCADLNIDRNTADEAWRNYETISTNYTLEGDRIHWLCCALYVACRNSSVPTVGQVGTVEGNCVSLTQLRRKCNISMLDFFDKSRKWADMANLSEELRRKFLRLERNFEVCSVIFRKYDDMFKEVFRDPSNETPRPPRSRKQRKLPCTVKEVYDFCWAFFVRVKTNYPQIHEELVSCFHLLLACLDYVYGNALVANRRDLLNATFAGLPSDFNSRDYKPPVELPCIIECLYLRYGQDERTVVDVIGTKKHVLTTYVKSLIEKETLRGDKRTLTGVLDAPVFEFNKKSIKNDYEDYVHRVGDFDECIFSSPQAPAEIGTPVKATFNSLASFAVEMQQVQTVYPARRNLNSQFDGSHHLAHATPLTGRNFLKAKEPGSVTPVSTATQSVSRLQALISGRQTGPSEDLTRIFRDCQTSPEHSVRTRVKDMGEKFCQHYVNNHASDDGRQGFSMDMARKRLQLGESLYYKVLENIINDEKRRLKPGTDLSGILQQDMLHRLLFTCCLEIVLFSYNSQRIFPWILEVFPIEPFYFYKVIEVLIRAEDQLSRDVIKHLNHMEEQILESMAWRYESPLWEYLKNSDKPVPSCEEVSLPSQLGLGLPVAAQSAPPTPSDATARPPSQQQPPLALPPTPVPYSPSTYSQHKRALGDSSLATSLLQSPVSSGASHNSERVSTPASARRTRFGSAKAPTSSAAAASPAAAPAPSAPTAAVAAEPAESKKVACHETQDGIGPSPSVDKADTNKPRRTGSLGLFFRKFYHLASVRLQDLCNRLELYEEDLRKKIWTCFEYSVMNHTELMQDRHLDQILMCAVYVICKVTEKDKSFTDIMRCYRSQPHASSHVYRSVLLCTKTRRGSASSSASGSTSSSGGNAASSTTPSPAPSEKEDEPSAGAATGAAAAPSAAPVRSSSTLPFPQPSSCPPTPTGLAGTASSFEYEDRGDLILFYNTVYVRRLQKFALKFSTRSRQETLPLSPLPLQRPATLSPRRKLTSKHLIYISPLKPNVVPNSPQPMRYSFNRSPSKDLHAINAFICEERSRKRPLAFEIGARDASTDANGMAPPPPKFPLTVDRAVARQISFQ